LDILTKRHLSRLAYGALGPLPPTASRELGYCFVRDAKVPKRQHNGVRDAKALVGYGGGG
jgi:hypothetical protein